MAATAPLAPPMVAAAPPDPAPAAGPSAPATADPRIARCGFAKLEGDGLEFFVTKLSFTLGRRSKSGAADVELGDNMNISRQHARIAWNFEKGGWELTVMGKNGVSLNGNHLSPGAPPAALKSRDALAAGDVSLRFLLPSARAPTLTAAGIRQPSSAARRASAGAAPPSPADVAAKIAAALAEAAGGAGGGVGGPGAGGGAGAAGGAGGEEGGPGAGGRAGVAGEAPSAAAREAPPAAPPPLAEPDA